MVFPGTLYPFHCRVGAIVMAICVPLLFLGAVVTGIFKPVYRGLTGWVPAVHGFHADLVCLIFGRVVRPDCFFLSVYSSKEAFDLYHMAKGAVLGENIQSVFKGRPHRRLP